jgi:hypothetical protein
MPFTGLSCPPVPSAGPACLDSKVVFADEGRASDDATRQAPAASESLRKPLRLHFTVCFSFSSLDQRRRLLRLPKELIHPVLRHTNFIGPVQFSELAVIIPAITAKINQEKGLSRSGDTIGPEVVWV